MTTIDNKSYYINQNTGQMTVNQANTAFRGTREELDAMNKTYAMGGRLYTGDEYNRFQADLKNGMFDRLNIGSGTVLNKNENTLNLGVGKTFTLKSGKTLTLNSSGWFEVSGGTPYDRQADQEASDIAGALNILLRYSTGQISENALLFSNGNQKQKWSSDALKGLEYLGIDTSRDFVLNGTKFIIHDGTIETKKYSEAQAAYKIQADKNRTYQYADEKTKIRIRYQTDYFLRSASDDVKAAWQKALEETNFNPFSNEYSNALFQISMEQDFATGGNDNIFGNTIESAVEGINSILQRAESPLGETDVEYSRKEQEFYHKFLDKIMEIQ